MPPSIQIPRIFVYGTLQRGECRERCWPHAPLRIDEATIRASLYDLGPYPAIGEGQDLVCGELWEIEAAYLDETLRVLDQVEGYAQLGDNLYVRRLVVCRLDDGREVQAWTYFYGDAQRLTQFRPLSPDATGLVRWRERS